MKLSEAILLGSTMIKPKAGVFITEDKKQGCAWGYGDGRRPGELSPICGDGKLA